jgi:hypothetical protein
MPAISSALHGRWLTHYRSHIIARSLVSHLITRSIRASIRTLLTRGSLTPDRT